MAGASRTSIARACHHSCDLSGAADRVGGRRQGFQAAGLGTSRAVGHRRRIEGMGAGASAQQLTSRCARRWSALCWRLCLSLPLAVVIAFTTTDAPAHLSDSAGAAVGAQGGARTARYSVARHRELAEDRHRGAGLLLPDPGECRGRIRGRAENHAGSDALAPCISGSRIFRRLRVPIATPHLFTGCKIAITFAVIGAVIGEFVAAQEGLGYLILISTAQSQTPLAFAAIILLTVISVVLFYAVELLEKRFVTWTP